MISKIYEIEFAISVTESYNIIYKHDLSVSEIELLWSIFQSKDKLKNAILKELIQYITDLLIICVIDLNKKISLKITVGKL